MIGLLKKPLFNWPIRLKRNSKCTSYNSLSPLGARCPPSLHALNGIKAMSRGFSGGKQAGNFSTTRNRGRPYLFLTTENEQLFILKTIMANNGWK